ncbi:MAG: hypothetical protein UT03_C0035G0002 [Candidatus Moranbacteria bacterium GW2011_GWD2_38_7]|nr:MAG: hypothetical protein UT03_C0035G0002 [Candidatus Moranbacteria bacterium GW2011_GWD2_38_7]
MQYGYKKQVNLPFAETEKRIREELAKEGFGIITEINVKETFKKKLDVDFENYIILGACHPASAYKILQADKEMGLLLPCNVLVYEDKGSVYVSTVLPKALIAAIGEDSEIAREIEDKLKKVIDAV